MQAKLLKSIGLVALIVGTAGLSAQAFEAKQITFKKALPQYPDSLLKVVLIDGVPYVQ